MMSLMQIFAEICKQFLCAFLCHLVLLLVNTIIFVSHVMMQTLRNMLLFDCTSVTEFCNDNYQCYFCLEILFCARFYSVWKTSFYI